MEHLPFRRFGKVSKSEYNLRHACPCVSQFALDNLASSKWIFVQCYFRVDYKPDGKINPL